MNENKEFKPYVPAEKITPEFTVTSIVMGIILAVVFGAANAYLGLRVGMTVSASIPAAVISMGVIRVIMKKNSILESNMVQTIGSAGESLAAGAIFTMPALFLWANEGLCDKPSLVEITLIALCGGILGVLLVLRSETTHVFSDRGTIVPSRLWRVGRSREASIFQRELKGDARDFVVDVLIDASGSQMSRQGEVALQAYMISEALSNVEIPHRVMSFCTFWDYTILHRFREYDDPREENENIFNYVTSSNNRDGLALKTVGYGLLQREEEKKILIVLSDGRPYDVIVNRPNARNPQPYQGKYAVADTATEVRRLRNLGVSVLGVFAGEEKDLQTEKKIFGKDFAYIRDISGFSRIVGRYLTKQLDQDE